MSLLRVIGLCAISAVLTACSSETSPDRNLPVAVNVVEATASSLPLELTYSARTAGSREVEVRARVSGILEKRLFEEGSFVKEGALLFRIDSASLSAAADQARAELASAEAQFQKARLDRDRILPLFQQGAVSQRDRDGAVSTYQSAEATVAASRAALRTAQLNRSYAEVRAPISGVTSREARSEGSLVTAGTESSLLTRIVQTDLLYVEFAVPEEEAVLLRGALAQPDANIAVDIASSTGGEAGNVAHLSFVDTVVDGASGTVATRAVLDNASHPLIPGQFVRVTVKGIALPAAPVIPTRAVMRGPTGSFVWVLDRDDKAEPRPVKLGRSQGNLVTVVEGLAPGERYVVDGVIKLHPGAALSPTSVTLEQAIGPAPTQQPA